MNARAKKPIVLVLGTGFAALRFVKKIATDYYDVALISPRNYFLFTPLLASTAVGTIEFRSIVEPIRSASDSFKYYQASCSEIIPGKNLIRCDSASGGASFDLSYDYLIIAVGATTATFGVEGVGSYSLLLKDIPDAQEVRAQIVRCFERANEPNLSDQQRQEALHFVVIGGGPTGVEFAAELHDLIHQDLSRRYEDLLEHVRITLLEASDRLLGSFDAQLSLYTARAFAKQKIQVVTHSKVAAIEKDRVRLSDGSTMRAGFILWSAGIAPIPLIEKLAFEKQQSRLLTDEYLNVIGQANIFALGDCAAVRDQSYPATGQLAQSQGKYLATSLNRRARGKKVNPYRFINLGMLAYVGSNKALMDVPNFKLRGFIAWLLWRSIYLTKLVSLRNKVSVFFDWIRTSLFGRDFSRF